jgi:hypothetical protein
LVASTAINVAGKTYLKEKREDENGIDNTPTFKLSSVDFPTNLFHDNINVIEGAVV